MPGSGNQGGSQLPPWQEGRALVPFRLKERSGRCSCVGKAKRRDSGPRQWSTALADSRSSRQGGGPHAETGGLLRGRYPDGTRRGDSKWTAPRWPCGARWRGLLVLEGAAPVMASEAGPGPVARCDFSRPAVIDRMGSLRSCSARGGQAELCQPWRQMFRRPEPWCAFAWRYGEALLALIGPSGLLGYEEGGGRTGLVAAGPCGDLFPMRVEKDSPCASRYCPRCSDDGCARRPGAHGGFHPHPRCVSQPRSAPRLDRR